MIVNFPKRRRLEVFHKNHRYWSSVATLGGVRVFRFWSDHDWTTWESGFYHGWYVAYADTTNDEIWQAFVAWLPFKLEEATER